MGLSFSHGLRVTENGGAYHTQRQAIWAGFGADFSARGATRRSPVDLAKLEKGTGWHGFGWVFGSRLPPLVGVNLSNSWGDWLGLSVGLVGHRVIVNWHKVTTLKRCY